jgi:hypothetical protein
MLINDMRNRLEHGLELRDVGVFCVAFVHQRHDKVAIRVESLLLGANVWPEAEKARNGLLITSSGGGFKLGIKRFQQSIP